MGKGVFITTTLIAWCGFNPHPGHIVASMDKTLYDDYLCLVASNQQQIQRQKIAEIYGTLEHWKLLSRCGFLQPRSNYHNESARIVQSLAPNAVMWQKNKYATQQQQQNAVILELFS